jgi:hypothetical protein
MFQSNLLYNRWSFSVSWCQAPLSLMTWPTYCLHLLLGVISNEGPDLLHGQYLGLWRAKSSEMWCSVTGCVVPDIARDHHAFIIMVKQSKNSLTLKMEAVLSFEILGTTWMIMHRHTAEDLYVQQYCCENLSFCILVFVMYMQSVWKVMSPCLCLYSQTRYQHET